MSKNNKPLLDTAALTADFPEQELYRVYAETIESRFPAFSVRSYGSTIRDMALPFIPYDGSQQIDQGLIDTIVTRKSHERFTEDVADHEKKHGLQSWRDYEGTTVYAVDHGQFTDVPVLAETHGIINDENRHLTTQVISKMITAMELDVGNGPFVVSDKLTHISNLLQTLPRLEGNASHSLIDYRGSENERALTVLDKITDTKGTNTIMSVIGRHNAESKNKKRLFIHEPNRKTLEALMKPHIKVVPVYIHCPTFKPDGSVEPADIQYVLFEPFTVTDAKKDTVTIVNLFKDATQQTLGHQYPSGIVVRSWRTQQGIRRTKNLRQRIAHKSEVTSDY